MTSRGFTLIELLIVVAIIGVLAAIAVPNFLNARIRANLARVHSDQRTLENALEMYALDHGVYPYWPGLSEMDYRGYRLLTTPAAYLNGVLLDPFASVQRPSGERSVLDEVYEFTFAKTGWADARLYFALSGAVRWDMFLIESVGPNRIDDFFPSLEFPSHPPGFVFYDPSNGLVSRGDILRAGGAHVPRWYRERRTGPETTGLE